MVSSSSKFPAAGATQLLLEHFHVVMEPACWHVINSFFNLRLTFQTPLDRQKGGATFGSLGFTPLNNGPEQASTDHFPLTLDSMEMLKPHSQ